MSKPSSKFIAKGFSLKQCFPLCSDFVIISLWAAGIVKLIIKSISLLSAISSTDEI